MAVGEDARGVFTNSNNVPMSCSYPGQRSEGARARTTARARKSMCIRTEAWGRQKTRKLLAIESKMVACQRREKFALGLRYVVIYLGRNFIKVL